MDASKASSNRDSGNGTCTESLPDDDQTYDSPVMESHDVTSLSHEASYNTMVVLFSAAYTSFSVVSSAIFNF